MKPLSADGSVGSPHVRVGHRQALIRKPRIRLGTGLFYAWGDREAVHQLGSLRCLAFAMAALAHLGLTVHAHPHVRVGHRQALNTKPSPFGRGFFI